MKDRYINQSKAYKMLKHEADVHELPATKEAYERAARIIDSMDSEDVEFIKHGRWERRAKDIYACTECTNEVSYRQSRSFSLCPYCGARMDGEKV